MMHLHGPRTIPRSVAAQKVKFSEHAAQDCLQAMLTLVLSEKRSGLERACSENPLTGCTSQALVTLR